MSSPPTPGAYPRRARARAPPHPRDNPRSPDRTVTGWVLLVCVLLATAPAAGFAPTGTRGRRGIRVVASRTLARFPRAPKPRFRAPAPSQRPRAPAHLTLSRVPPR